MELNGIKVLKTIVMTNILEKHGLGTLPTWREVFNKDPQLAKFLLVIDRKFNEIWEETIEPLKLPKEIEELIMLRFRGFYEAALSTYNDGEIEVQKYHEIVDRLSDEIEKVIDSYSIAQLKKIEPILKADPSPKNLKYLAEVIHQRKVFHLEAKVMGWPLRGYEEFVTQYFISLYDLLQNYKTPQPGEGKIPLLPVSTVPAAWQDLNQGSYAMAIAYIGQYSKKQFSDIYLPHSWTSESSTQKILEHYNKLKSKSDRVAKVVKKRSKTNRLEYFAGAIMILTKVNPQLVSIVEAEMEEFRNKPLDKE